MRPHGWRWRATMGSLCVGLCLARASALWAEEASVPVALQVELMLKVAAYDKNMAVRAKGEMRVAVVVNPHDSDSVRLGGQAMRSLAATSSVDGLAVRSLRLEVTEPEPLAQQVRSEGISIVYLMVGFPEAQTRAISERLSGISVLSVGAIERYAHEGAVLSFDLVSGKPKFVVNLEAAKRQSVELSAAVLKLMRVLP